MSAHLVDAESEFQRLWQAYQQDGRARHAGLGSRPVVVAIGLEREAGAAGGVEVVAAAEVVLAAARRAGAGVVVSRPSGEAGAGDPADDVVVTPGVSAFFGTDLVSRLIRRRTDTVLIVGVPTSGGVHATAVDAAQHGFSVVVVQDAVADRERLPHLAALFDLGTKYAGLVTVKEAVTYLGTLG